MPEESYLEYMFKGTTIAFVATVLTGVFSLGMRMFLSRALPPSDYGIFFAVVSLVGFLRLFRGLGLTSAIIKFLPEYEENENFTGLKSSVVVSLLIQLLAASTIGGILFIFSGQIALQFVGSASAISVIRILSVWFILMVLLRIGSAVFLGFKDISGSKSVELVRILSILVIVAILGYIVDIRAIEAALAFLLGSVLATIWVFIRSRKHSSKLSKGKIIISKSIAKKVIFFGLPLIFASLAGAVTGYIDTIVITIFRTPEEVGFYQIARPATRIISMAGLAVGTPLFPMISELWAKKDSERLRSTLYFLTKFSFLFLIPILLIFLSFPKIIIRVLFSPEYLPATESLRILSLTMLAVVLFQLLGKTMIGIGENSLYSKLYGLAAVLNLAGDITLVPLIGIEGAALAFLFSFLVSFILGLHYIRKYIEFTFPIQDIGKMILGGMIIIALIFVLKSSIPFPMWPKLVGIIVPSGFLYLIWILKSEALTREDLRVLRETIPIPEWMSKFLRKLAK